LVRVVITFARAVSGTSAHERQVLFCVFRGNIRDGTQKFPAFQAHHAMKPKFQPDLEAAEEAALSPSAPGFESYDASEERFAASLDEQGPVQTPKFIPEIEGEVSAMALAEGGPVAQPAEEDFAPLPSLPEEPPAAVQESSVAWKQEVLAGEPIPRPPPSQASPLSLPGLEV
jgi:hypothetical protein